MTSLPTDDVQLKQIATSAVNQSDISKLGSLLTHLFNKDSPIQQLPNAFQTIITVAEHILALFKNDEDCGIEIPDLIKVLNNRIIPNLNQLSNTTSQIPNVQTQNQLFALQIQFIDFLSLCYQADGDYKSAAVALGSSKYPENLISDDISLNRQRLDWMIREAEYYLAAGETALASQVIKHTHQLISDYKSSSDDKLLLRFKTVYARILDSERKFIEAATRYYELSFAIASDSAQSKSDLKLTLEKSVDCLILSPSGSPQRSKLLNQFVSDIRFQQLNCRNFDMLMKIAKNQVITPNEFQTYQRQLPEHYNAMTLAGQTVAQNCILQHNLSAISSHYTTIKLNELQNLLNCQSVSEVEQLCCSMIESNRLNAKINHLTQTCDFISDRNVLLTANDTSNAMPIADQFEVLCDKLAQISDRILAEYPQLNVAKTQSV